MTKNFMDSQVRNQATNFVPYNSKAITKEDIIGSDDDQDSQIDNDVSQLHTNFKRVNPFVPEK